MKIRYPIAALLSVLIALPDLSAQKSVYTFPFENSYKLPSMQKMINSDELANTYQTRGNIYTTEITGMGDDLVEQTSMSFVSDVRVMDAVRFLEFYMEEQLVAPGDESAGIVELSIIYFHEHNRFNIRSVIGILTFGLGTLMGIPYSTVVIDVETEAMLYDQDDYLMAGYRGVGRGKKLQSIYSMSSRKAHQRAIKHSLEALNTNIMEDQNVQQVVQIDH